MAPDRVAQSGSRTDQVLAFHFARTHAASSSGAIVQASLDSRTRLLRTEARTRTGDIMKDEAGAVFTTTLRSALRPMGSWWPNGAVPPSARAGQVDVPAPQMPRQFRPRGSPGARGAA